MEITPKELVNETSATYRQIDYWCRIGIISPIGNRSPGSGNPRRFEEEIIDRVKLLVKVSNGFFRVIHGNLLKKVYHHYDEGYIDLGEGITLHWGNAVKISCKGCGLFSAPAWYKCCEEHTPQENNDYMCQLCASKLHPGIFCD